MRSSLIFMVLCCIIVGTLSRPPREDDSNESEAEENEYEGAGDDANDDSLRDEGGDSLRDDSVSRVDEQVPAADNGAEKAENPRQYTSGNLLSQRDTGGERRAENTDENFSEYKTRKNTNIQAGANEPIKEYQSTRELNKYRDNIGANNEQREEGDNNYKLSIRENKRILKSCTKGNDEGELLFENSAEEEPVENSRYNDQPGEPSEQSRYYKQFYNTMQAEHKENNANEQDNLNRDRREVSDSIQNETSGSPNTLIDDVNRGSTTAEDEEAAIRRHVKKLSGQEMKELLNSLSEDKRELLKRIMDSDEESNNDNINKREITKKAGAAEENSYLDGEKSEANKVQEGGASLDVHNAGTSQQSSSESTKQPETQTDDIAVTKNLETSKSSSNSETKVSPASISDLNQSETDGNFNSISTIGTKDQLSLGSCTPKTEIKREANLDDLTNMDASLDDATMFDNTHHKNADDSSIDRGYAQNDDLSQLSDEETELHDYHENLDKREATYLSDSMKSLEESFPNSNSYDASDPYFGSDMEPLVRVKRDHDGLVIKKRGAALLPDAKVAYFPYRSENDDEDSDEGNEFDDDGFYDRTSNLAKANVNDKPLEEESPNNITVPKLRSNFKDDHSNEKPCKLTQSNTMESDTMSLGSDTDSVISGAEGVDENLMYKSASRKRRAQEDTPKGKCDSANVRQSRPLRSTPFIDDELNTASDNSINGMKYQENDAFGPLPRSYEGDLDRHKRVRHIRPAPEDEPSSTT